MSCTSQFPQAGLAFIPLSTLAFKSLYSSLSWFVKASENVWKKLAPRVIEAAAFDSTAKNKLYVLLCLYRCRAKNAWENYSKMDFRGQKVRFLTF